MSIKIVKYRHKLYQFKNLILNTGKQRLASIICLIFPPSTRLLEPTVQRPGPIEMLFIKVVLRYICN